MQALPPSTSDSCATFGELVPGHGQDHDEVLEPGRGVPQRGSPAWRSCRGGRRTVVRTWREPRGGRAVQGLRPSVTGGWSPVGSTQRAWSRTSTSTCSSFGSADAGLGRCGTGRGLRRDPMIPAGAVRASAPAGAQGERPVIRSFPAALLLGHERWSEDAASDLPCCAARCRCRQGLARRFGGDGGEQVGPVAERRIMHEMIFSGLSDRKSRPSPVVVVVPSSAFGHRGGSETTSVSRVQQKRVLQQGHSRGAGSAPRRRPRSCLPHQSRR